MGAGGFGDTLLQTLFLPTYTWKWLNVCRLFKRIRLLLKISSSNLWITRLNNVILEVASNMSILQLSIISFSWLHMSPEWLVQQVKTNSERKELHDILVDQITQIPIANSTLSPSLFHARSTSTTLQNDKDARRFPFLWQIHQTHDFSYDCSVYIHNFDDIRNGII